MFRLTIAGKSDFAPRNRIFDDLLSEFSGGICNNSGLKYQSIENHYIFGKLRTTGFAWHPLDTSYSCPIWEKLRLRFHSFCTFFRKSTEVGRQPFELFHRIFGLISHTHILLAGFPHVTLVSEGYYWILDWYDSGMGRILSPETIFGVLNGPFCPDFGRYVFHFAPSL